MGAEHKLSEIRTYTTKPLVRPFVVALAALKVHPTTVTRIGEGVAMASIVAMRMPKEVSAVISCVTLGKVSLSEQIVENTGKKLWATAVIGDALDGELARYTNQESPEGAHADATADRRVDLLDPALDASLSGNWFDRMIAKINLATNSVPALLRAEAEIYGIEVPEFAISGSRGVRLATQAVGFFSRRLRRASQVALVTESVTTAVLRYKHILETGNKEAIAATNNMLKDHFGTFFATRLVPAPALAKNLITWGVLVGEYSKLKHKAIFGE